MQNIESYRQQKINARQNEYDRVNEHYQTIIANASDAMKDVYINDYKKAIEDLDSKYGKKKTV